MLCLYGMAAFAQEYAVGTRQGIGMWFTKNGKGKGSLKYAPGNHFTWNKELFIRKHASNGWAYELSLNNYCINYSNEEKGEGNTTYYHHKGNFFETNFIVQYDVTYPLAAYMFPALSGMKSFFGFSATPRFAFDRVEKVVYMSPTDTLQSASRNYETSFFIGFYYTHYIPITEHWVLTSAFSFKMQPFNRYMRADDDFYRPNRQLAFQTGLCYKF